MNVGDVYWIDLPPRGGHAQAGRRPGIIVQGARSSAQLPTVLLVPLTTQLEALRFPGTVLVETDETNGLRRRSVALVFQLTAVDKRDLGTRLGAVSATVMGAIWQAFDEISERIEWPSTPPDETAS
jgi:mRNA-degrading endonuclease toxin of MazEF toxin-antitoxin module